MNLCSDMRIEHWSIDKLVLHARNPRKNDAAVDRMCSSIREFGFQSPVLARSDVEVVDGHLGIKAARKLGIAEIPVLLGDEWTPAQVKAFRLMVNRSVARADWEELLALELDEPRRPTSTSRSPASALTRSMLCPQSSRPQCRQRAPGPPRILSRARLASGSAASLTNLATI